MPAIRVENLGKQYRLGATHAGSIRELVNRTVGRLRGRKEHTVPVGRNGALTSGPAENGAGEFWALKDVSFQVQPGEVVGVIGRNGAGKSTLLKILSGITAPTTGRVELHGRVASLLEVGTGFHPELTGRENVFLNGAILGMSKAEIRRKFDEIVAFAEVEQFIDTPVKRYSSGMYVRLAFAVAAHLEPEILLVDEVLAVGDAAFQKKCLGKMDDVAKQGRTIIFVSHNMAAINRLCNTTYWLQGGRVRQAGPTNDVVTGYVGNQCVAGGRVTWSNGVANERETAFAFLGLELLNDGLQPTDIFLGSKPIRVRFTFQVKRRLKSARVGFLVSSPDGSVILEAYDADAGEATPERAPGVYTVSALLPANLFNDGHFLVSLNAGIPGVRNLCYLENALSFRVDNLAVTGRDFNVKRAGCLLPRLAWQVEQG